MCRGGKPDRGPSICILPPGCSILHSTHLESSQEWLRRLTQSSHYQENGHLKKKSYVNKFGDNETGKGG